MIRIEVAYARPGEQVVLALEVAPGTTVAQAVRQSGLLKRFPEIDLTHNRVGIFGTQVSLDYTPAAGDRVEIYRPLRVNPREVRRQLAARQAGRES